MAPTNLGSYLNRVAHHVVECPFVLVQLITPESFAGKLKNAADKQNLFVVMGVLNAGTIACFGVVAFIDPMLAVLLADITTIAGGAGAVSLYCVPMKSGPETFLHHS